VPMTPLAQQSMQADLERLRAQRDRYALALQSSEDERAIDRHARTITRLDEEILATEQALGTLQTVAAPQRRDPWGMPVVDATVELAPEAFDDGVYARQASAAHTRKVGMVVGLAVAGVGAALWLGLRPAPKPIVPVTAPAASVVVSSPVPPDPDDAPSRARPEPRTP
jgi:hypothetical protein